MDEHFHLNMTDELEEYIDKDIIFDIDEYLVLEVPYPPLDFSTIE